MIKARSAALKGFLADGNFSAAERALIKSVTQKSLLYLLDAGLMDGGTAGYDYGGTLNILLANYDSAYYQMVTDSVFLLDPKQLTGMYALFGDYVIDFTDYWLRAPDSTKYTDSSPSNVLYLRTDSKILYSHANDGDIGVRPALYLKHGTFKLTGGDGSDFDPYVISG